MKHSKDTLAKLERRVARLKCEDRIFRMYSRGHISWAEGMDRLRQVGVDADRARRVLLGIA